MCRENMDINSPTPPGIAFIVAFALLYYGIMASNVMMQVAGWIFVMVGIFLQGLYLRYRYRNGRNHTAAVKPVVR